MSAALIVRHNVAATCYDVDVEGHRAVTEYRMDGDCVVFTHTFVPPELRGRGIAEAMVRFALADARRKGLRVVPECTYVAAFIRRNPEFND